MLGLRQGSTHERHADPPSIAATGLPARPMPRGIGLGV